MNSGLPELLWYYSIVIVKIWSICRLHDTNGDFMLDGLELFKAWQHHYLEHMGQDGLSHTDNSTEEMKKYIEQQNESFVSKYHHDEPKWLLMNGVIL